jgi:hypothetical protein
MMARGDTLSGGGMTVVKCFRTRQRSHDTNIVHRAKLYYSSNPLLVRALIHTARRVVLEDASWTGWTW